tara:strand:- start:886 stop:1506 length:621 start_codon:yes stop_codon:yes gene_type:complete
MSFWTKTSLEPKRQYRFRLTIEKVEGSSAIWYAKKVTIPSFTVGEIKHSFVDKTFYFPGRVEWNAVEATLVDPVQPDAVHMTNKILAASGYFVPANASDDAQWGSMSKSEAAGQAIGYVYIDIIDQDGKMLERWQLNNPFVKSAKYGDVSYDADELREITLEFRYDWATCLISSEHPDQNARSAEHFKQTPSKGKEEAKAKSKVGN